MSSYEELELEQFASIAEMFYSLYKKKKNAGGPLDPPVFFLPRFF